jgi:hypothetical protein
LVRFLWYFSLAHQHEVDATGVCNQQQQHI